VVTIREVAEVAGVSIGTVSRVLNQKAGVSEKTRQHVLEITKELDYHPTKRLQLHHRNVSNLGLLIRPTENPLTSDPFYGGIFYGVENRCQEHHISVSFNTLDFHDHRLRRLPTILKDERNSGFVLLGALPKEIVTAVEETIRVPIVLVDNHYTSCRWDSVMIDNLEGAYTATKFLISASHKNIVMLSGPDHPSILERRDGFRRAMCEQNLNPIIIETHSDSPRDGLSPRDGEKGIEEVLLQAPETTAVFCSNDNQAIGAIKKLHESGLRIPEDISIIGFDDVMLGSFTSPPITTIHVDRVTLGKMAVEILLDRINNPDRAVVKVIVGTRLVERGSVSLPKRNLNIAQQLVNDDISPETAETAIQRS
jgi:LacI family transcriptional regulator